MNRQKLFRMSKIPESCEKKAVFVFATFTHTVYSHNSIYSETTLTLVCRIFSSHTKILICLDFDMPIHRHHNQGQYTRILDSLSMYVNIKIENYHGEISHIESRCHTRLGPEAENILWQQAEAS